MKRRMMKELAAAINAYLKRIEADPKLNPEDRPNGCRPYYNARCGYYGGSRVTVCYVSYQGLSTLTRDEAERYLAWLDAGNVGQHYAALTEPVRRKR